MQILTIVAMVAAFFGYVTINWWVVGLVWFLMGPVGIGVCFHRLLSHRQFETWKPVEYVMAFFGTVAGYAPIIFFSANHIYHHKVSDSENDPSSPRFGFWESFLWWRMRESVLKKIHIRNKPVKQILADPVLRFMSVNFMNIVYFYVLVLFIIGGPWAVVNFFLIPAFIEHLRVNLISSVSHIDIPGSYRNHNTKDTSQNHYLFGILSFGFGWHNNHHARAGLLDMQENWWELDIEGLIGRLLTKPQAK
jgi:fatty-acid desaturase